MFLSAKEWPRPVIIEQAGLLAGSEIDSCEQKLGLWILGFHSNGLDRFHTAFDSIRSMHLVESGLWKRSGDHDHFMRARPFFSWARQSSCLWSFFCDRGHFGSPRSFWVTVAIFGDRGHSFWLMFIFMNEVIFAGRGHIWWLRPFSLTTVNLFERFLFLWPCLFWFIMAIFGDCGRIKYPQPFWLTAIIVSDRAYLSWPRLFLVTTVIFWWLNLIFCDQIHFYVRCSFFFTAAILAHRGHLWWSRTFLVTTVSFSDHGNFWVRGYFGLNAVIFPGHF